MWKYYNNSLAFYFWLVSIMVWTACANPRPPTGGQEDETAPKVLWNESDANMQTNFNGRSFELTFDEWVSLKDAFNQVVVTPPLEFSPDISLKKRTVIFELDGKEQLRENATYIINFGEAVKDNNEGLSAKDLRFVFSTGDYIDSLSVQGKVINALTGEPAKDVFVMLYDNLADSVVHTERPFYFSRTTAQGTFKIDNVRADTFKVFGLVDKNFNYLFDLPTEEIAYMEKPIVLSDSVSPIIQMELFQEAQVLKMIGKELKRFGKITLVFNQEPQEKIQITFDSLLTQHQLVFEKDSVHLWYDLSNDSTNWALYVQNDTLEVDTIKIKAVDREKFLAKAKLKLAKNALKKLSRQKLKDPIELLFNRPLAQIDLDSILLLEDTLKRAVKPMVKIKEGEPSVLQLSYDWKKDLAYEMFLLPGAVTDWYDLKNDSIPVPFTLVESEAFGNLLIKVTDMDKEMPYVLKLFIGEELVDETVIQADSVYLKEYKAMEPGIYSMRIIADANGNSRWDPGNYKQKTQAEKWYFGAFEELRANWDVEAKFSVKNSEKKNNDEIKNR